MRLMLSLAVLVAAFFISGTAQAYYPQFAERYYNTYAPRYYQPYRYASPYRPYGYGYDYRGYRSYAPPGGYDWSWGGGNRAYLGGPAGGWGREW